MSFFAKTASIGDLIVSAAKIVGEKISDEYFRVLEAIVFSLSSPH
jgi:hypothetical protein